MDVMITGSINTQVFITPQVLHHLERLSITYQSHIQEAVHEEITNIINIGMSGLSFIELCFGIWVLVHVMEEV